VAWMRMMGAESVAYHRATVLERGDDYPGMALAYYASRGETPLRWGGTGAVSLGLDGAVSPEGYEAIFGPGGARHPGSGERLVTARRPGMELVISAHKSVAELGVIGRAEHMHGIMDAERDATLDYLDRVTRQAGGRRGRSATATATGGLVYAHTRHATSRAGDPCPHDHVLLANVIEMLDGRGGWKAADTALWREHLHAATMLGRVAAARAAVDLGYGIEADRGPSGRLRHWRLAGVPDEVIDVHSKRSAEIDAECQRRGDNSSKARAVAARTTRTAKEQGMEGELVGRWQSELASIGWPVERLAVVIDRAGGEIGAPSRLTLKSVRRTLAQVLSGEGELARRKVFSRRHLLVELAPHLFGQDPAIVDVLADRALQDPEVIPLVGVAGAREQPHALASVLAAEAAIADAVGRQLDRADAPVAGPVAVTEAVAATERNIGGALSAEQRDAAASICGSGRGAELVVGVAGAGKTTMLQVVAAAFEGSGCQVIGTATSGQAARTLSREAEVSEARTLASLVWRLDHQQLVLDEQTVVILDEAGMTDDAHLVALTARIEVAGAKLVIVGDHYQLGSVGSGGALAALVGRHPDALHRLVDNRRQRDPDERHILAELRDGSVAEAVAWYHTHGRIHPASDRDDAICDAVGAWAADVAAGQETGLYAWRRANVAALNTEAREWMEASGRLSGPELVCPGGARYRAGDRVVTLAPGPSGTLVTSQRAVVDAVDPEAQTLILRADDGQHVVLHTEDAGADRLGYGYATTVHRAQGATVERAHLFADGGGRELAYVAMSRARESTQVWAVADDPAQAAEDLRRDWATRHTPTWAIDTALPDPASLDRDRYQALPKDQQTRLAALFNAEQAIGAAAINGIGLPDRAATLWQAQQALDAARQARADLDQGSGIWADTEAGRAVTDLARAGAARQQAAEMAEHGARWRDRHAARKHAHQAAALQTDAQQRYAALVQPHIERLDQEIARHQTSLERTAGRVERQQATTATVIEAGLKHRRHARQIAGQLRDYRDDIDGVPTRADIRRAATPSQARPGPVQGPAARAWSAGDQIRRFPVPNRELPVSPHTGPDL
jgi:conjugative relaxase-like TrwC/TraI family protein